MRRGHPEFMPRHAPMPDIPIERDSVGAMGLSDAPAPRFVAYVYRGKGYDQYEFDYRGLPSEPMPAPKVITQSEQDAKERAREVARKKYLAKKRREERWVAQQMAERAAYEASLVPQVIRPEVDNFEPFSPSDLRLVSDSSDTQPRRVPRPSPGWRPMTGADIEELLGEMQ